MRIKDPGSSDVRRLSATVAERARGREGRPRMSDEVEARLARLERESAACYADAEALAYKARCLAERISGTHGAVPEAVDDEDSLVHHIQEARARASGAMDSSDPASPKSIH